MSPGAPGGAYFGQVDYVVSGDACGKFLFGYVGAPNLETIIVDENGQAVVSAVFDPLAIAVLPQNDLCADAIVVSDGTHAYDTTCGAVDGPQTCAVGADVFFEYTATCTGDLPGRCQRPLHR